MRLLLRVPALGEGAIDARLVDEVLYVRMPMLDDSGALVALLPAANADLALFLVIEGAAAISRNLAELWLLSMPLLGVGGAYFL